MRILLDECVDQRLRLLLVGHDCHTAAYAGLAGLKNGVLLDAAEDAGFEVMITLRNGQPNEAGLEGRPLSATRELMAISQGGFPVLPPP